MDVDVGLEGGVGDGGIEVYDVWWLFFFVEVGVDFLYEGCFVWVCYVGLVEGWVRNGGVYYEFVMLIIMMVMGGLVFGVCVGFVDVDVIVVVWLVVFGMGRILFRF